MLTAEGITITAHALRADPPAKQRRVQGIARLILAKCGNTGIKRDQDLLIGLLQVYGWKNGRLHLAAYWPGKTKG